MNSLIYTSQANILFSKSELQKLVSNSQRKNTCRSITGYLYFREDIFLQYLEGQPEDLERVFEKISDDDRHNILNVINFYQLTDRLFPQWTMRLIDPHEAEEAQLLEDILIDMMNNQDELGFVNNAILKTIERLSIIKN